MQPRYWMREESLFWKWAGVPCSKNTSFTFKSKGLSWMKRSIGGTREVMVEKRWCLNETHGFCGIQKYVYLQYILSPSFWHLSCLWTMWLTWRILCQPSVKPHPPSFSVFLGLRFVMTSFISVCHSIGSTNPTTPTQRIQRSKAWDCFNTQSFKPLKPLIPRV